MTGSTLVISLCNNKIPVHEDLLIMLSFAKKLIYCGNFPSPFMNTPNCIIHESFKLLVSHINILIRVALSTCNQIWSRDSNVSISSPTDGTNLVFTVIYSCRIFSVQHCNWDITNVTFHNLKTIHTDKLSWRNYSTLWPHGIKKPLPVKCEWMFDLVKCGRYWASVPRQFIADVK